MTDGDGIGLGLHLLDSPEYISRGSRSDSSLSEIGFDADDLSRLRNLDSPDPPASEVHRLQCELPYLARDHANALLDLLKAGKVFRNPGASAARVAGPRRVKAVLRAAEHATIVCGPMDSRALMFLIGALDLAVDDVIGPTDALTEMRAAGDRVVARVDLRTLKAPFAAAEAAVQHIDGPLRRYAVGGWFATEHDVRAACDGAPPFHAVHSLVCHLPSRAGGGLPLGPLATTLFRSAVAGGCRPGRALVYARSALRGLGEQVAELLRDALRTQAAFDRYWGTRHLEHLVTVCLPLVDRFGAELRAALDDFTAATLPDFGARCIGVCIRDAAAAGEPSVVAELLHVTYPRRLPPKAPPPCAFARAQPDPAADFAPCLAKCASAGRVAVVELLLRYVTRRDGAGAVAEDVLYAAAAAGHAATVSALLRGGWPLRLRPEQVQGLPDASRRVIDDWQCLGPQLLSAVEQHSPTEVRALLARGADAGFVEPSGARRSALVLAIDKRQASIAEVLLRTGRVHPCDCDGRGVTPVMAAARHGDLFCGTLQKLLDEFGAAPSANFLEFETGKGALEVAGSDSARAMLRSAGAVPVVSGGCVLL